MAGLILPARRAVAGDIAGLLVEGENDDSKGDDDEATAIAGTDSNAAEEEEDDDDEDDDDLAASAAGQAGIVAPPSGRGCGDVMKEAAKLELPWCDSLRFLILSRVSSMPLMLACTWSWSVSTSDTRLRITMSCCSAVRDAISAFSARCPSLCSSLFACASCSSARETLRLRSSSRSIPSLMRWCVDEIEVSRSPLAGSCESLVLLDKVACLR